MWYDMHTMKRTADINTPRWLEGVCLNPRDAKQEMIARRFVGTCKSAGVPLALTFREVGAWVEAHPDWNPKGGIICALWYAQRAVSDVTGAPSMDYNEDLPVVKPATREEVLIATPHRVRRKIKRGTIVCPMDKVFVGGGALPFS